MQRKKLFDFEFGRDPRTTLLTPQEVYEQFEEAYALAQHDFAYHITDSGCAGCFREKFYQELIEFVLKEDYDFRDFIGVKLCLTIKQEYDKFVALRLQTWRRFIIALYAFIEMGCSEQTQIAHSARDEYLMDIEMKKSNLP